MSSTALSPNSTSKLSLNLFNYTRSTNSVLQSIEANPLPHPSFPHSSKSLHRPQTSRPSRRQSKGTILSSSPSPSLSISKPPNPLPSRFLQTPLTRNNISPAAYAKTKKPLETNVCCSVTATIHRKNVRARWRGIGIVCAGLGLVHRELSG